MNSKTNYTTIILSIVIAIILLSVLPLLTNMSIDCPPCEPISSEPIPSYPTNVVVFKSDSPRTITPKYTQSGITLQYSIDNGSTWNNIESGGTTASSDEIWFRGRATGSKGLYTSSDISNAWVFSGDESNKLHVYGDLRYLLCNELGDKIINFNIANYCFHSMFINCTSLTTPPSLPAFTLASNCYGYMFKDCTSLITVPFLPARDLKIGCYIEMFSGCTSLKVSETKTGSYLYSWRIPTSGTGTTAEGWNTGMLANTGGTFTSNPTINTTYYLENQPV